MCWKVFHNLYFPTEWFSTLIESIKKYGLEKKTKNNKKKKLQALAIKLIFLA